ncbi:MAG: hypothetical protein IT453_21510 [Planctomycetes bacterium]|nr:hypothetical protein [Planctomycetota bacterium]
MWTLALALCFVPAAVQDPATERPAFVQEGEPVDRALDALAQALQAHSAPRPAFEALIEALEAEAKAHASEARAQTLRDRLRAVVEELRSRAEAGLFDADALARLREDVLDARAERALAWLEERAVARHATRAEFERVGALLEARLARATEQPDADGNSRERWKKLVADVQARQDAGGATAADFVALREELVASRLERALAWLEQKALARGATRVDFARVRAALEDRAAAAGAVGGGDELERLQKALAKLEERALNAEITRDEFREVAQKLIGKAREAGATRR